jgi:hypothetical protein
MTRTATRWLPLAAAALALSACGAAVPAIPAPSPSANSAPNLSADAIHYCRDTVVTGKLRSPATAKYSNEAVSEMAGIYTVTGSVDAQNGFGALIRGTFICQLRPGGGGWVVDSADVGAPS